jgi:uncharacterized low-complexity protein
MSNKTTHTLGLALGAAFATGLMMAPVTQAFAVTDLDHGYQLVGEEKKDETKTDKEGSCGEGKCGEGKDKEGSCGEGKCGEGHDKDKEGSCGEGKCGEGKCGGAA